jgi:molecular chaperone GrpE
MTIDDIQGTPINLDHELPQGNSAGDTPAGEPSELEKARAEAAMNLDRLARLQAEFDNFRKRNLREQKDYRDYALAEAIKQLLPILDSLDRAAKSEASVEDMRAGLELIDRQFHDVLTRLGVEPLDAKGTPFDPNLHQAIQMVPSEDAPDNQVLDELQRGYKLRDRVLRAAMVRVAQNPGK